MDTLISLFGYDNMSIGMSLVCCIPTPSAVCLKSGQEEVDGLSGTGTQGHGGPSRIVVSHTDPEGLAALSANPFIDRSRSGDIDSKCYPSTFSAISQ